MSENENIKIVSDRPQKEWIPGCPVQVKQIRIVRENDALSMVVTSVPCGGFSIKNYTADIEYTGAKRQSVGVTETAVLTAGESVPVAVPFDDAVYAYVKVRSVTFVDG